jgi:hypothetical protein
LQHCRFIFILLGSLALIMACGKAPNRIESTPVNPAGNEDMAAPRRELIARHVLAAQLATHDEIEASTTFSPTESIPASLYLTPSSHIEARRISAFLIRDEIVFEEQSITLKANEKQQEFDFRFAKAPRPLGAYQIKFIEIARSNGKPVLLARLFLKVDNLSQNSQGFKTDRTSPTLPKWLRTSFI